MTGVYGRCRANLEAGYGVCLLVPEHGVVGAKQNAEAIAPGQIGVQAIESIVAQNLTNSLSSVRKTVARNCVNWLKHITVVSMRANLISHCSWNFHRISRPENSEPEVVFTKVSWGY